MIKLSSIAIITLILISSCRKSSIYKPVVETGHPQMIYKSLGDVAIKYLQPKTIDLDEDGIADILFSVQLVGDPILQRDRLQFFAYSKVKRSLLNDNSGESPVLNKLDLISKNFQGYMWYELSFIVLAEKIIENSGSYWAGLWKNADHKYLPIQVEKTGKVFHAWIELSFDSTEEKLVLHKAAISTLENVEIKAGY